MTLPLFDLTGRTALITGGSRGLGFAIARGLAQAGASVILAARDPDRLAAAVTTLRDQGLAGDSRVLDVTDGEAVRALVDALPPIDILVNNAGIQHRAKITEFPDAKWDEMLATHLTAAFRLAKQIAPGMIERGGGKIINIASLASSLARATVVPYAAAKGGLYMLTRGLAADLGQHNIQSNAIGPGYIRTDMNEALMANPEFDAWVKRRNPTGRWGEPDDLVGAAVFLASRASDYVNGQIIYVDGGLTAVM